MRFNTFALPEYRCDCGKLLFKGILMLSSIEIKCRNCGKVRAIGRKHEDLPENQYAFVSAISTKDAYAQDDPSPFVVDVTDSALAILGWERDELVGREVRSIDPLSKSGAYGKLWKYLIAKKFQPFTLEAYQPKKDGSFVRSRARTTFQHTKDIIYLITVFDLLENPSVPHELPLGQMSAEKLFSSFELQINTQGTCDSVTYEFACMLGYLITDIAGHPFVSLYPKTIAEERRAKLREMLRGHTSFRIMRDTLEARGGALCHFDSFFTARYTDTGIFDGFTVTLWPISPTRKEH